MKNLSQTPPNFSDLNATETSREQIQIAQSLGREKLGEMIYLAMYGPEGAVWAANESKPVWYAAGDRLAKMLSGRTGSGAYTAEGKEELDEQ